MSTTAVDRPATARRLPARAHAARSATELRRQASRPRTQLALGFMVLLPLIILVAFEFGGDDGDDDNGGGAFASLVDLATSGGLNFALFTLLRLVVVPAGRGGRAVLRRHRGQRGELGQPALPAGDPGARGPGCSA